MVDASMMLYQVEARTMNELIAVFDAASLQMSEFIETMEAMTQIFVLQKNIMDL